jgi:hypothetical protein
MIVMERPDGTFIAWAGPDERVGVDYVEDCPEHAQAAAMFALKRKSRETINALAIVPRLR